ncbi:MAG: RNA 3'-phosphate cyclase [Promethearchaeota archaeon]|nr:MAG: RNA 3'-phosphate cyclase [Candidatus Lokiarchaeota archaeon]
MEYLSIDGTMGEGGGSITRLAAGFSILFNQPIHLKNIRANRSPPGLRLQHQLGLESLQKLSNGELSSIEVGTTDLKFAPGTGGENTLDVNIKTAGSIALLSQTIQTAFIHSNSVKSIKINYIGGGTFGRGAPDPYYLNNVTYRFFSQMGYKCHIDVKKNGYYPKGGAMASLTIEPIRNVSDLKPLVITDKGDLHKICGIISCSENLQKPKVAERIYQSIFENLRKHPHYFHLSEEDVQIDLLYERTLNPGVGLSIWANYDHTVIGTGTLLGKQGVPSEKVGKNAVDHLIHETVNSATVDSYAADQLIPLMVMCPSESKILVREVTSHLKTNIDLLQQFHPRNYILKKEGDLWVLQYKSWN